jgi:D-tyrosyl-tRNA(Tyr) deacylase
MRAVIQRVSHASVVVDKETVGAIDQGLMVLLGVAQGDTPKDTVYLADKTAGLRIFEDEGGKMNLSVEDIDGDILVVSQFTLLGDCRKGRRPGFTEAAPPELADTLYEEYVDALRKRGINVATGVFRADMQVALVNDGPVTIMLDSRKQF